VIGEIVLVHARDGIIDPLPERVCEPRYRPIGRLFANRYCTTRQRFEPPGERPEWPAAGTLSLGDQAEILLAVAGP